MRRQSYLIGARTAALLAVLGCGANLAVGQSADKVERIPIPNSDFPISAAVVVAAGYDTIYVSGNIAKVANRGCAPKGNTEGLASPLCTGGDRSNYHSQALAVTGALSLNGD
jgi:hypothetical protein